MKELDEKTYKAKLIEILDFINKLCEKYNIKYSLIGGSLIGAVREKGIIPWDDDIDIALLPDEYQKLLDVLLNKQNKYGVIDYNKVGYYNPFIKIVDKETCIIESGEKKEYGIFIDVFKYNVVPDNIIKKAIYLLKYKYMLTIIHGFNNESSKTNNVIKKIRNIISKTKNPQQYIEKFNLFASKYNKSKSKKLLHNGAVYSLKREMAETKYTQNYKMVTFDNIKAMIWKNYDPILKNTFGDYMTPPPLNQRIGIHNIKAYIKEKNEKN